MRLLLAAVTMLLLAGVPQPVPTVLRFGHVWDGSRLLDDVAVVVSGDRIVSVTDGQRGLAWDALLDQKNRLDGEMMFAQTMSPR